jgi:DNA-directed RNA polymerase specialized sigma24 family protein
VTPSQERAFTDFVRANGDVLLRQARLLVPYDGEAEDLLQVALLRLGHCRRPRPGPAATDPTPPFAYNR